MFDFETTLSGINYKIRQLIQENESLRRELLKSTEANEELKENIKNHI